MKANTKSFLLNLFGSLFSNARAIDGARTSPFFVAIILFIVANFLPVIPIMTTTANTKGSSFLNGNTYGVEIALAEQTHAISEKYTFKVNDEDKLIAYDSSNQVYTPTNENEPLVEHYVNQNTGNIDLEVYYVNRITKSKDESVKTVQTFVNALDDRTFKTGTTTLYSKKDKDDTTPVYRPSYIVLYPEGVLMAVCKDSSTTMALASYSGMDWKKFDKNTDVISVLATVTDNAGKNVEFNLRNATYVDGVMNNWKATFDKAFLNRKTLNFWGQSGLYYGIYLALTITLGSLLFLLTRGKKNPFNYMKFHTCLAIEGWSILSPAILGMIVGFLFIRYALMGYIMLLGLRTMWISMKQLRPQY